MNDEPLSPRTSRALFGHDAAEQAFLSALEGRMPHAWLISGPKGTGKATLAYRMARRVLAGGDEGAKRRIEAGSHAGLLVVEAPYDPEKEEARQEIPVEAARAIPEFMSLTPAEGQWRMVIIDSVDDLNANAANAILKILEEPPPRALLLLISHNPARLLPTIRSRCRALKLAPLKAEDFTQAMRHLAPELEEEDIEKLGALSRYSPGLALELARSQALELYGGLTDIVARLATGAPAGLAAFADEALAGAVHKNWRILGLLLSRLLERTVEAGLERPTERALAAGEGEAIAALLALRPPVWWAQQCAAVSRQFSVAARLHLDYKTVLIASLQALPQQELALTA